jgi:hypothetical protein
MRTIKTSSGASITLDGDILAVMEALYKEVTAKRELERSFEDMVKEGAPDLSGREPVSQHGEI